MLQILIIVVLVLVIAMAVLWWQQEKILFQPPGHVDLDYASADKIEFTAVDGQKLFGYMVGEITRSPVILAFHGNADLAIWQLEWAGEVVHRFGVAVFLAEYRGYGGIKGRPTYANSSIDADAAYKMLASMLPSPGTDVVYFGHSLGSAVATELAARHPTKALLLQSPFTSAREMAGLTVARFFGSLWKLVSRIHFDNVALVRKLDAQVSVIHGTSDLVIPHRMGEAVYKAARIKGAFTLIEKAGHNNIVEVAGESYWNWFGAALQNATPESAAR